ncbi:CCA tRNA nucleotidyltransferase [Neoroseomonas lacus]|uniref:Cytidine(C)-cytidine(C)-adenosine (A)]-adding enzyme n=1 Tax=Neoroseomonas lacus TaxID=287609 RepID=A0A917KLQ2_9PROT|nr:CCA tRNA nucleotidyltransferase [Neoroseomonas lacus]GGJ19616.1 cytidine(C)-cytidine(C)-adenosine (A)]-adding enzyme [Neoroseomonas lacus]
MNDAPGVPIRRPAFLDEPAVAAVLAALPGARAVGGCVRDALAARTSADVDVAAPFTPEEISARLRAAGLKVFETGLAHGTVTAVKAHQPVEVTALRRDVLTDGRHAVVEWTTDWHEDAARRDFTINAMSLTPEGMLFDYFGGRADLAAGLVRFVGDADTRLAEDYLRALRFFRFQARYGRGAPDAAAVAAIGRAVPGLARLSAERVWMELKRILAVPDPVATLALMAATGVLGAMLPEARPPGLVPRLVAIGAPAEAMLRLSGLLAGSGAATGRLSRRLRFSGSEAALLDALLGGTEGEGSNLFRLAPTLAGADLRRVLTQADQRWRGVDATALLLARSWLAQALPREDWAMPGTWSGEAAAWDALRARIAAEPVPMFPLAGRDALALGLAAGPAIGIALDAVRQWWVARGCGDDLEACRAELRRRLSADGGGAALGG